MTRVRLLRFLAFLSAFFVIGSFMMLIGFLLYHGTPVLDAGLFFGETDPIDAITGARPVWDGIWPAFAGTLYLIALTMAVSLIPGIGCGIYLARYAKGKRKRCFLWLWTCWQASLPSLWAFWVCAYPPAQTNFCA